VTVTIWIAAGISDLGYEFSVTNGAEVAVEKERGKSRDRLSE